MSDITIYRKDYQPPAFAVETINLDFDLYDDHALVTNRMQLSRQNDGPLVLFGDELELISIQMNDKILSANQYRIEAGNLIIEDCAPRPFLTITTRIRPQDNTHLSGLYRAQSIFCTQCEAEGFRRITFFFDRPDVLATYTTRISADKSQYPILLSNGNLLDSGDGENGRHWAIWHDPFKKPSYLFALVAGDLACVTGEYVTASGKKVDLCVYVEFGNEDKCQHAVESLKKAMRWDEQEFGREYDLDIYMIVAVSDFNMGAMENKGLNIFNSKYILARPDTATDIDYGDVEGVIGHEYFHNWTGNRVTCQDWFQLSLKEGLTVFRDQEFSGDMNSRDVNRIMDVKALRNLQFPEDAGAMAHPVRPESYQEINNFYTATIYNKGAEVIRMQRTLLGKEGFRRGMDLYFQRNDGKAVTIDDFVKAMEDANRVDFGQLKLWYSQAGTPEVTVKSDFANGTLKLTLSQSCPPTPESKEKQPFHIPIRIALFNAQGEQIPLKDSILELREPQQTFTFTNLAEKPLVSLLREFSAPIIMHQSLDENDLLKLLRFETDGFAKWDASQKLSLQFITKCYQSQRKNWEMPDSLITALKQVLEDESIDPSLRAEILMPPSFEEAAAGINEVDVEKLEEAREFFKSQLGRGLSASAQAIYSKLWQQEDHQMHGEAYARRKLRNVCLWLLMKADEKHALPISKNQFSQARTMTDQIASFSVLVNGSDDAARRKAIDDFYQQWKGEDLVLDKWFTLQATCELPATLKQVRHLLKHPAFNIKNPNKVRALIGAFTQANPRNFHALDGSGYEFLTEMLLKMDQLNPQIAARLATPYTRARRLNAARQSLIQKELQRLAKADLSRDLRELVEKSLVR